jgi:hypothetical protein
MSLAGGLVRRAISKNARFSRRAARRLNGLLRHSFLDTLSANTIIATKSAKISIFYGVFPKKIAHGIR